MTKHQVPGRLEVPHVRWHASFLRAIDEDDPTATDVTFGYGNWDGHDVRDPDGFAAFIAAIAADELPDTPRPDGFVPSTVRWWVTDDEVLGRIAIRHDPHERNDSLRDHGGLIGYVTRPSARGRGIATAMLRAALPLAAAIGIRDAHITADPDNVASHRVIEANGGRLVGRHHGKVHYRIRTDQ